MKNTKIQITLVIRPEPGSNDVDGVIFQNTTTANSNTRKWMDDTMGAIKRLVLDHINKGENTLAEEKTDDSTPQSAAQDDADEKPEKKEAEEERRDAVKGLMLLRCPACKKTFIKFSRQWVTSLECSCGEILWLNQDSTARFEFECESCGHRTYGHTNLESAVIEAGSLRCNCGQPCPEMLWRPDIKEYRS